MVTGAARGIGRAIAEGLAESGATIAVCDVLDEVGEATVAELRDRGVEAAYQHVDVSNAAGVEAAVGAIVERFGRLDIAVNNAGIRAVSPVAELPVADWDRVIAVNLSGVFYSMKYQIPHLVQTQGSVVNIASIWGLDGWPGRAAYVASKHGVVGLTKSAAHDYGSSGVRINAVAPGPISTVAAVGTVKAKGEDLDGITQRTALKRFGEPQDVASAVVWLCSASNVTGTVVSVDGGWGAV